MHEKSGQTSEYPPNDLTEFVLDKTPTFEDLNAPTSEEGKDKFRAELAKAIGNSRIGQEIGDGFYNTVYELKDDDAVVIKALRTRIYTDSAEISQQWQEIQTDHQTVVTYLGGRFVPDTEFIVLDLALDPAAPSPHPEYIAVQERAAGQKFSELPEDLPASPELKAEVAEYIIRVEHMMRDGIVLDHPDDLMVNDTPDASRRLTILDTNSLCRFKDAVNGRNATIFMEEYGIDPTSIRTSEDIIRMVHDIAPSLLGLEAHEAEELRAQDYHVLMGKLHEDKGDLARQIRGVLRRVPSNSQSIPEELKNNPYLDQVLFSGFSALTSLAERFAPEGQHPQAITTIMDKFGISDADLVDNNKNKII